MTIENLIEKVKDRAKTRSKEERKNLLIDAEILTKEGFYDPRFFSRETLELDKNKRSLKKKFEYTSGCATFVLRVDEKRFDGKDKRYCHTLEEQEDIIEYFKYHANKEFLKEYYNQEYYVPDDTNAIIEYVQRYGKILYEDFEPCEYCGDYVTTYELEM